MPAPGMNEPPRCRCAFDYAIDRDLRFLSHRDMLRMFRRALARAELPVRFTEGFNPHPRMAIVWPRPVGIASEAETIIVEFAEPIDPNDALRKLERETPRDLRMQHARMLDADERLLPAAVRYRLDVEPEQRSDLDARVRRVEKAAMLEVERLDHKRKQRRTVDLRPYLTEINFDRGSVRFTLRVTETGTAKPAEVAALLGFDPQTVNHRIHRIEVRTGS
jgi:radical SAM-linked protein